MMERPDGDAEARASALVEYLRGTCNAMPSWVQEDPDETFLTDAVDDERVAGHEAARLAAQQQERAVELAQLTLRQTTDTVINGLQGFGAAFYLIRDRKSAG
mgnify:CR=1 FL=1